MAKFWQDPGALAINRRQSHTPLKSYVAPAAAAKQLALPTQGYAPAGSREQLLSGCDWRFKLFDSLEAVPADFHDTSYDEDGFTTVSISSYSSSWMVCAGTAVVPEAQQQYRGCATSETAAVALQQQHEQRDHQQLQCSWVAWASSTSAAAAL
jgi:hypothetical protein